MRIFSWRLILIVSTAISLICYPKPAKAMTLTSLLGATRPLLRSSLSDDPEYRLNIRKFCVAVAMILQSRFLLSMAVLFTVLIALTARRAE